VFIQIFLKSRRKTSKSTCGSEEKEIGGKGGPSRDMVVWKSVKKIV
jgi:hypothetical protein